MRRLDTFDELGVEFGVGVSTAYDAADALAFESLGLSEHCTERERARRLSLHVCQRKQHPHSFLDLVLRDFDDPGESIPEDLPVSVAETENSRAVGDGCSFTLLCDEMPGS